ncbi:MAG: hypothetical protein CAPSK01_003209 [Candidatus Accumulibacter vicinus]|uniref:Uncharacterized protein n=1 Tax=Candidatus Accumulibacter vicinus TaxID=2954382 RepID=A0A084XYA5_9PROT|nr:MAG: hypothetical protein CAPSK01_003209 [Candidatus Accumulibacter vicinus]
MPTSHLGRWQAAGLREFIEIRPAGSHLVAVTYRQLPDTSAPLLIPGRRRAQCSLCVCRNDRFDFGARAQQGVIDDGQRTEGRHRFDDPVQLAAVDRPRQRCVERRDRGQQVPLDVLAKLDGQRRIPGVEDAKAHAAISFRSPGRHACTTRPPLLAFHPGSAEILEIPPQGRLLDADSFAHEVFWQRGQQ